MHPILGDRRRLGVFLAIWIPVGLAISVLPYWWMFGNVDGIWPVAVWIGLFVVPLLASWYVVRFATMEASGWHILATVVVASFVVTGLWIGAGRLLLQTLAFTNADDLRRIFVRDFTPFMFVMTAMAFAGMSAVYYALAAADQGREATQRALHADIAAREAELRALRSQVNPHFLFNCLHSISALVPSDPQGARRMCLELADFFRDSLRAGSQPRVSMDIEAALVRRYLDIERVRFGDRLRTTISLGPGAEHAMVPPLLLQPLAENAVRHGIATLIEGGEITIAIARDADRVTVSVENPFDPDGRRPGTGVGLANVRARLETTFGSRAYLRVDDQADYNGPPHRNMDARFRVTLSLPLEVAA